MESVIIIIVVLIYFTPTFIALARKKPNQDWICLLNIMAGWTLIGWVAAFALAAS